MQTEQQVASRRVSTPLPPKPYPTFALFAHANGQWRKKIAGQQVSFGRREWPNREAYQQSWRDALAAFDRSCRAAATQDAYAARPDTLPLHAIVNHHLAAAQWRRWRRLAEARKGKQLWTPDELAAFWHYADRPLKAWIGLAYFAAFGQQDCADLPARAIEFDAIPDGSALLKWSRPKTEIDRAALLPARLVTELRAAIAERPKPLGRDDLALVSLAPGGRRVVRVNQHHDDAGLLRRAVRIDTVKHAFEQLRARTAMPEAWRAMPAARAARQGPPSRPLGRAGRRLPIRRVLRARCPTCDAATSPMRQGGFYTFRHTATTYAIPAASLEARRQFQGHAVHGARSTYIDEIDVGERRAVTSPATASTTCSSTMRRPRRRGEPAIRRVLVPRTRRRASSTSCLAIADASQSIPRTSSSLATTSSAGRC